MSIRREIEALLAEFLPDEEEMQRQIREEYRRAHERGQQIREGDTAMLLMLRWSRQMGETLADILRRRGLLSDEDEE